MARRSPAAEGAKPSARTIPAPASDITSSDELQRAGRETTLPVLSPAIARTLQRQVGNRTVAKLVRRASASQGTVQRFREFDKVAGTKDYANGGKGIDGEDDSYHISMNPRGPDSPVYNHFNELHVTFDEDSEGYELDWSARPHFYYSDEANPAYIPKDDTAANRRFREDHAVDDKFGESDEGWGEYEELKKRSKPIAQGIIPKLPVYEGKTVPDVQAVHAARLLKEQQEAAAKLAAEQAAAAELAEDEAAEKAGKMKLKITYDNSRHKKANVESWGNAIKTNTGAATMTASKAQGRGAALCTVILGFTSFKDAKAARAEIGATKEPGNGEALTFAFIA